MRLPPSSTPSRSVPPAEFMKAATVLATTSSMASSRLSVRRFQRAEDLNSRRSDSPIWATSAIGSSAGWCWTRASTAEVATSTTTATPQEVASILNENRSPSSKIQPASSSPSHRPTSAMSVAAAPDTETRPRSRNRVSRPTRKDSRSSSGWAMTHQMRMGLAGLVMVTVSMLSTCVRFSSSRCLAARAQGGRGWAECDSGCGWRRCWTGPDVGARRRRAVSPHDCARPGVARL